MTMAPGWLVCWRPAAAGLALWVLASPAAWAQVYAGESPGGTVVLSYRQTPETPDLLVTAPPAASEEIQTVANPAPEGSTGADANPPARIPKLPDHLRPLILKAAQMQQVPASLIAAVAAAESGFDPSARSPKGAVGLMQLMPATARRFNVNDRQSAAQSLQGGAAYLRWLTDHFGADLERVIAAYNAGEQAVERAAGVPPYPETRAYLPRVLGYLKHFQRVFPSSVPG